MDVERLMMIGRRGFLACLSALTVVFGGRVKAQPRQAARPGPKVFSPFELQAGDAALAAIGDGLQGFRADRVGDTIHRVWLQSRDGRLWILGVDARDLQFKFEVFTLFLESLEGLQARVAAWNPPTVPDDVPEPFTRLMLTRPAQPQAPDAFEPWPFKSHRCDVLRRTEFIIEDVEAGSTFGSNPALRDAGRRVPPDVSAVCEVAAGLLFTAPEGHRLLAAVDWTPTNMIWTRDSERIDAYLSECESVGLPEYVGRFRNR